MTIHCIHCPDYDPNNMYDPATEVAAAAAGDAAAHLAEKAGKSPDEVAIAATKAAQKDEKDAGMTLQRAAEAAARAAGKAAG